MIFSTLPDTSPISDELLSAYIDSQVSDAERERVEQALAADPELQQRLLALQHTVALLGQTPRVPAPRAFVLSEAQVLAAGGHVAGVSPQGFLARLLNALSATMPLATAAVAMALLVVVGLDAWPRAQSLSPQGIESFGIAEEAPVEAPMALQAPAPEAESAQAAQAQKVVQATVEVESGGEAPAMAEEMEAPAAAADAAIEEAEAMAAQPSSQLETARAATIPPAAEGRGGGGEPSPSVAQGSSTLRLIEILLAALLLVMLAGTWLLRRGAA